MEDNFITPIQPMNLTAIQPIRLSSEAAQSTEVKGQTGIETFKGIFENLIDNVKTTDDTYVKEQYRLATGDIDDPHSVMIASRQAQLAVDMLVALRSQALQSYNEILRISS